MKKLTFKLLYCILQTFIQSKGYKMSTERKIKKYLENSKLYTRALLLDDSWGSGKSTLVKNSLSGKIKDNNFKIENIKYYTIINGNDINQKTSLRQLLISSSKKINTENFFNINEDKETIQNLANFLGSHKKNLSEVFKKSREAIDGYIKNKTGVENLIGESLQIFGMTGESALKKLDYTGYVLVIDEIDRMNDKSNLKNIYSKIIELQENTPVRIIVILNSEKIDKEIHDEWKDKIYSAVIKIENSEYFNSIKPSIWDEVEEDLKKMTTNYKNIRALHTYKELDDHIDEKINEKLKNEDQILNKYQKEEINNHKASLIKKVYAYYNKDDYKKYKGARYNEDEYLTEIDEIYQIINLSDHSLFNKFNEIINYYNKDYARLKDAISDYFKKYIHFDFKKSDLKKKTEVFDFVKNTIIKENLALINLTHTREKIFEDENSIMYFLTALKRDFKISRHEEKQIIELMIKKLKMELKNINELPINNLIDEIVKLKNMYKNITNEFFLNENDKFVILKNIKKIIKKLIKLILESYADNLPLSMKYFHFRHNTNIIDDIHNNLDDKYILLLKLRTLKDYNNDNFSKLYLNYYGSLKKEKIMKKVMNKV